MTVRLNHTIVRARDKGKSSTWVAEILGLPEPGHFGPFRTVEVENDVTLDFIDTDEEIESQHYAFLVGEDDFDQIFGRILERDVAHWADPGQQQPGRINTRDNGRGVYFEDPDGHLLEILTRPYGG